MTKYQYTYSTMYAIIMVMYGAFCSHFLHGSVASSVSYMPRAAMQTAGGGVYARAFDQLGDIIPLLESFLYTSPSREAVYSLSSKLSDFGNLCHSTPITYFAGYEGTKRFLVDLLKKEAYHVQQLALAVDVDEVKAYCKRMQKDRKKDIISHAHAVSSLKRIRGEIRKKILEGHRDSNDTSMQHSAIGSKRSGSEAELELCSALRRKLSVSNQ